MQLQNCVNSSDHANTVNGKTIYLGFGYLKNLEHLVVQKILSERQINGLYLSFTDFLDRIVISIEQLTILIKIDAFRFTRKQKPELLWQALFRLQKTKVNHNSIQQKLFKSKYKTFVIPEMKIHWVENVYDEIEL